MSLPSFQIDSDIGRARTPPAELYTDEGFFAAVRERVFAQSWQWIEASLGPKSSARPTCLLEGLLNVPLVVTRDKGGVERCLSNVCTHRGYLVCRSASEQHGLRCGYHGRRFGLDGSFQHMPEFEGVSDFPSHADDLARLALRRWGPLAFTSCAPGGPRPGFDAWLGPLRERLGFLPLADFTLDHDGARSYEFEANWALYCENFLEGFHIPFVHASLNQVLDFGAYRVELQPHGTLQVGVAEEGQPAFELPSSSPEAGLRVGAYYAWLFPNLMLNFYPWGLSLNLVVPLAAGRTRVDYRRYLWRPELLEQGAGADLHRVELEDESVVEGVQQGVGSPLYQPGRYSPRHERGTHHFHRLLAAALDAS